jgi:hypothetical protein
LCSRLSTIARRAPDGARQWRSILDFLLDVVGSAREIFAALLDVLTKAFYGIASAETEYGQGERKAGNSKILHG